MMRVIAVRGGRVEAKRQEADAVFFTISQQHFQ